MSDRASAAPGPAPARRVLRPKSLEAVAIALALLVGWEVLARTVLAGAYVLAPPTEIVARLAADWPLYATNLRATVGTALRGFAYGNAAAVILAVLIVRWPLLERPLFSAALAIYSVPIIALAPILLVLLDRADAMVALSGLAVVFTTTIAATLGLRSADPAALDVIHVLGGGRWDQMIRVRLRAALPSLFAGLRVAAPAAVLGATVGEFMGAERGLGVLIVNALSSLETTRVWTVAALATGLSVTGYLVVDLIGRALTPWVDGMSVVQAVDRSALRSRRLPRRAGRLATTVAINLAVVIGGWALFIELAGLNAFFAKGPAEVWAYLLTAPDAAAHRAMVFGGLVTTLTDAGLGFAAGITGGVLAAAAFVLRPALLPAVMPFAIAMRSIPILATTPLVILLLGRGLVSTTVIIAILSFFPTLTNMLTGMRLTRRPILEVIEVLDGSRWDLLWRAQLPSALPALMASARVAVPSSILGAVIIEWLVTGEGMGKVILYGVYNADYNAHWAVALVLTLVTMALYGLVVLAERAVLRRYAPEHLG